VRVETGSRDDDTLPGEGYLPAGRGRLYWRAVGGGPPIVVLHGGPDFDHYYLRPELDRLAESFRLVYYDQRGRGRSGNGVDPREVSIESEVADLELVRCHFGFESVAVLGHSWGGLLAMEYAIRHPDRASHLILVNTAPASAQDARRFREHLLRARAAADVERMQAVASSARYRAGELEAEADYYRLHFGVTLRNRDILEQLVRRLRAHFTPAGVLAARAIEQRLYDETWDRDGYDLVPKLRQLQIPALVLHGEGDLVPVSMAERVAEALPRGRLVVLEDCGHFAPLEAPERLHEHIAMLFRRT
jgi:proline iminopeptidase